MTSHASMILCEFFHVDQLGVCISEQSHRLIVIMLDISDIDESKQRKLLGGTVMYFGSLF